MKIHLLLLLSFFFFACGTEEPQNGNSLPLSEEEKIAEAYKKQFRWGFINIHGELVIKADYEEVGNFNEGLCAVKKNNRWGFIDDKGKIVIEPKYKAVWEFWSGLAKVLNDDNKIGFIDKTGKEVIKPQYESAVNHRPIVVEKDGKYAYIWIDGEIFRGMEGFLYAEPFMDGGMAIVETEKGFGLINEAGEYYIKPHYDELKKGGHYSVAYRENGQWGVLDEKGGLVIEAQFQDIGILRNTVTYAMKNDLYGLIDWNGKFIVEPQYAQMWYAQEDLWAIVTTDGKHGFINSNGKIILPPEYDTVLRFQEGRSAILRNGLWAYINTTGQEITLFEYSSAWNFKGGLARAIVSDDRKVFIDKNGEVQFKVDFEDVRDFHEGLAKVQLKIK